MDTQSEGSTIPRNPPPPDQSYLSQSDGSSFLWASLTTAGQCSSSSSNADGPSFTPGMLTLQCIGKSWSLRLVIIPPQVGVGGYRNHVGRPALEASTLPVGYRGGGPWVGIDPRMSHTRCQHSTTRLSRRRSLSGDLTRDVPHSKPALYH